MSYKSDVRIRLLKEDYAELERQYLQKFANSKYDIEFWQDKDICKEEDTTIYFGWDSVKWYRNITDVEFEFEFVDFIMDYILDLKNYSYAIIGEEMEDIDTDQNGIVEYISIKREFEDDYIQ